MKSRKKRNKRRMCRSQERIVEEMCKRAPELAIDSEFLLRLLADDLDAVGSASTKEKAFNEHRHW